MSHQPGGAKPNRTLVAIVVAIVVAVAFGGGYLLAKNGKTAAELGASASGSTPTARPSRSHSPRPTATLTPTSSAEPPGDLKDGRYFVYVKKVEGGEEGPLLLTFDLAYFYTGDKANAVAASRGDEVPVPNDVYIVNDNPKLRQYPIASSVVVKYIPSGSTLKKGDIGAFEQAVNGTAQTDYPNMKYAPWWIAITDGQIRSIQQQYLP
jgi:hypothetical protein